MSSSLSREQFVELCGLIQALHDERITPQQSARLEEWVCRDEEAGRIYVQYMNLYARLRWDRRREPEPDRALPSGKAEASRTPILGFLGDVFRAGADLLARPPVLTLLLTIGLPGIVLLVLMVDATRQPPAPVAVAEITESHRCVWSEGDAERSKGTKLFSGQELQLREGLTEVTFTDGSQIILQGPTTFRIGNAGGGFLCGGRLAATVPPSAQGFTIQTPLATVVDLGTDFGVSVNAQGATEAHVFAGSVEVAAMVPAAEPSQPARKVHVGQAVKVCLVGAEKTPRMEAMAAAPTTFVRRIPASDNTGLPEPRILFAHRGDRDPTTEGWELHWNTRRGMKAEGCKVGPIDDQAAAAWSIDDRSGHSGGNYQILAKQGLTPEVAARAKANGWVMRARIKVVSGEPVVNGLCFCSYWGNDGEWLLRPMLDPSGDQCLYLRGRSSLGWNATVKIPDSRDRYVDYEVRYHPKTNDADVYVDGKLVATGCCKPRLGKKVLHFGTFTDRKAEVRFARVEWGCLGDLSGLRIE